MKILVIAPNWVGDMVMADTLFIALKKIYGKETIIDVVSQGYLLHIAQRMSEIRNVIELNAIHGEFGLLKRYKLGKSLRSERYDMAIVMPITWKSALVPFFAKIPIRVGHLGEARFGLINSIKKIDIKNPRMIDKYMSLCEKPIDIEYPKLVIDLENRKNICRILELDTSKPIAAFFIGAEYGETKRYPIEHFAKIATVLYERNFSVWVFGSKKDLELGNRLVGLAPNVINLCGKTNLNDAIDLISLADFAIANDSGLMHIAAATGVRVIAIYGSSTPHYTPPLTDKKDIVSLNLGCSPCFKKKCPLGDIKCLKNITPEMVLAHISILENREAA